MKKSNVPVFILAGGMGTRISEETHMKPKPMIEVGGIPILIHLMRSYYMHGFNDFVVCAGYRANDIKEFFANYELYMNHIEVDHREDASAPVKSVGINKEQEKWRVRVIDTGLETMTGARVARCLDFLEKEGDKFDTFAVTYGDGVSDVNLSRELDFHYEHKKIGTLVGVSPLSRFGELEIQECKVKSFLEKPEDNKGLINGGFFFFERDFRKYLDVDQNCILERTPLEGLTKNEQLMVYEHRGFWQCMDTLRDKQQLQKLWDSGNAPWTKLD